MVVILLVMRRATTEKSFEESFRFGDDQEMYEVEAQKGVVEQICEGRHV